MRHIIKLFLIDMLLKTSQLETEKEFILNGNRELAEANLVMEPELAERRCRLTDLADQGKTLCGSVQEQLTQLSKF